MNWDEFEKQNKRKSAFLTAGITALTILLMFLFGFRPPYPPAEAQGLTIDFGDSETGSGLFEPNSSPSSQSAYQPEEEKVETQDLEETIKLPDKKEQTKNTTTQNTSKETTTKTDPNLEYDPSKIKNTNTSSSSEGNSSKGGNQGEQDGIENGGTGPGQGTIGGNDWSLEGGGILSLPKPPAAENEEGNIRVKISVDRNGNVVKAEYERSGSTITDPGLIAQAIAAAKKAKCTANSEASAIRIGYITYRYRY